MNRYIRLETMWDASAWLDILGAEAQLVWIKLLCYAKGHGYDGRVKALSAISASRMWNVGEESVRQLLKAAEMHGALSVEGGDWIIVKWGEYQGDQTNAERQRRFRQSKSNGSNALRNEIEEKKREEKEPPISPNGECVKRFVKPSLEEIEAYIQERGLPITEGQAFQDYHDSRGWVVGGFPMKDWKAAIRTWEGNYKKRNAPKKDTAKEARDRMLGLI